MDISFTLCLHINSVFLFGAHNNNNQIFTKNRFSAKLVFIQTIGILFSCVCSFIYYAGKFT